MNPIARSLYFLYERRLLRQVRDGPMPGHVGLILDGNRRHARSEQIVDPREIYRPGAEKLDDVLAWCADLKIRAVTLWVLSTDNLKRAPDQVSGILAAVEAKLTALVDDPQIHRRRVQVRAVGKLELLPDSTMAAIQAAQAATAQYDSMMLTIAVAYGGRDEITDAVRSFLRANVADLASIDALVEQVTPEAIGRHLYTAELPDPDLIIRTSGELRLSGFLLWQSAYSEFYFSDVYWPAFRKIDFLRAIRSFQLRKRRYGG